MNAFSLQSYAFYIPLAVTIAVWVVAFLCIVFDEDNAGGPFFMAVCITLIAWVAFLIYALVTLTSALSKVAT